MQDLPKIIQLNSIGNTDLGFISVLENTNLPFIIKRVYWTYYTKQNVTRGHHAHLKLRQLLVAVSGKINITLINQANESFNFSLEKPDYALYIPQMYWRTINFSENAVLLCLASEEYDENDYIREFEKFI